MLSLCAGGRFNNFKAVLKQVIVSSVTNLKRWSNNFCENTKKGILSLCAEGGRTNNFKAVLRKIITFQICRKKVYQIYVQKEVNTTILGQNCCKQFL